MKKYLLAIILSLTYLSAFSQADILAGFYPNGQLGKKVLLKSINYAAPLYAANDTTAAFNDSAYYISTYVRSGDSLILTMKNSRRFAVYAPTTTGGGSSQWVTIGAGPDIYYSAGKVGIGSTTSPLELLHIQQNINSNVVNLVENTISTGTAAYAKFSAKTAAIQIDLGASTSTSIPAWNIASGDAFLFATGPIAISSQSGSIKLAPGGSEQMNMNSTRTLMNGTTDNGFGHKLQGTSLALNGTNTSNSQLKSGSIEFQTYAVNNEWFGSNTYFNGSNFVRRIAGYSSLFYFNGNEIQFRMGGTSSAGSTVTQGIPIKVVQGGTVLLGGDISSVVGTFTGHTVMINSTGVTYTTTSTPATPASGSVVEWWDGTNKRWKKSDGSTGIIY